jgi:hypothetical protein
MVVASRHTQKPLISAAETAREMANLAVKYSSDLGEKAAWPLEQFYKYVKNLPFRSDPMGHESIARPRLTMGESWPWRDCDDKSILMGAWCFANKVPFKFQASSKAPSGVLHHVYVVAKDKTGLPVVLDATYPRNTLGVMDRGTTKIQDLTGDIMDSTLNIFEGDMQPLLGFSARKFGRGVKRGIRKHGKLIAASAAGGPAGFIAYEAYRNRARLHGETDLSPELMGKSLFSKVAKKAGKFAKPIKSVTHVVLRTPGLKDAIAATIPGASAALSVARKVNKAYKATAPASASLTTSMDTTIPQSPEVAPMDMKKKLLIGGGVLAAVAAIIILKKKR